MSPSKFMLYLSSGDVAPALELLRRVCQPSSRSLPHITARYASMQVRPEVLAHYTNALIDDLILAEVTAFDDPADWPRGIRTLIIKCESEDLEWLSYKPDFPDSVFHFTIYDGQPSLFALSVLERMRRFPWNLRLIRAQERVEPYEKSKSSIQPGDRPVLTTAASALLERVRTETGVNASLTDMSDDDRLIIVDAVCSFIHSSPEVAQAGEHPIDLDENQVSRYAGQEQYWSIDTIDDPSPQLVKIPDEREAAMFLTPPEIAFDMARAAINLVGPGSGIHFGDPAVGPGIFYAALRQVAEDRRFLSAVGVEIDPARARATAQRWRRSGLKVVLGDFLTKEPLTQRWNVLLANPPYVRHQEIDRPLGWLRGALAQRTGILIDGRSDLYTYFVLSAHDWLLDGAVAAWLLPSEFVATDFGRALRHYLTRDVSLKRLHFYDAESQLFDNARISSAVIIYERSGTSANDVVEVSRGGTLERPDYHSTVSISELAATKKWNWAALTSVDNYSLPTIGDIFEIKRGIATGSNADFVLTDEDLQRLQVGRQWRRPLLPKSRSLESLIIEADENGDPLVPSPRWLIDTSEPLHKIRQDSPKFADYLEQLKPAIGTRSLVRQRHPFYKQENRESPDFVFKYMAKSDLDGANRFIWNKSRAVVLNNYLGLYLRPEIAAKAALDTSIEALIYQALCSISGIDLARHGRMYVSGLLKLEPGDLARVRVNLPADWVPGIL